MCNYLYVIIQFIRLSVNLLVCLLISMFLINYLFLLFYFLCRVSPEELFIDLAVNNVDTTAADRLAIITGLDVNTLYEVMCIFI